jgi:hypothetical protein
MLVTCPGRPELFCEQAIVGKNRGFTYHREQEMGPRSDDDGLGWVEKQADSESPCAFHKPKMPLFVHPLLISFSRMVGPARTVELHCAAPLPLLTSCFCALLCSCESDGASTAAVLDVRKITMQVTTPRTNPSVVTLSESFVSCIIANAASCGAAARSWWRSASTARTA